jgi:hypothetical protein|tara:strand:+ start:810 stop:1607 length:798 start_codon:yes stop_codon:yes gene_type:complete
MFRILAVAVVVSLTISGASSYYLREMLVDEVTEARRQATSQVRRVEADVAEANTVLRERSDSLQDNMISYANEFRGNKEEHLLYKEMNEEVFSSIRNRFAAIGLEQAEGYAANEAQDQRIEEAQQGVAHLHVMVGETDARILDLSSLVQELRSLTIKPTATEEYQDVISQLESCALTPINRTEQMEPLQRAAEEANTPGIHNVVVKFDVTRKGDTVLQGMESQTAPSKLMGAVSRYVNGLKFGNQGKSMRGCEMVVRLDIDKRRY